MRRASTTDRSNERDHRLMVWGGASVVVMLLAGYLLWHWWARPPAVAFENLRYIQLLRTAVSSRNADWVSKVELAVSQRKQAGQMSPGEFEHFAALIAEAKTGEWEQAEQLCLAFERAQQNRRRAEQTSSGHAHDHAHDQAQQRDPQQRDPQQRDPQQRDRRQP